jgi:hypothetical protein
MSGTQSGSRLRRFGSLQATLNAKRRRPDNLRRRGQTGVELCVYFAREQAQAVRRVVVRE